MPTRSYDVVVIGAGQAGLAVGYHLQKHGILHVIVDAHERLGETWRRRWDSLRLFTPAQLDGLPGFPFPASRDSFPTKDEIAEYLAAYAARFDLPIELGRRVHRLRAHERGYRLDVDGESIVAGRVVIATGANQVPKVPAFASAIHENILQLHSAEYQSPAQVPPGDVLVIGAGTSGVEIALELASTHRVRLAGRLPFRLPPLALEHAGDACFWLITHAMTVRTPMGRRARRAILAGAGAPLIRAGAEELATAGVERLPRVVGVQAGLPCLADGRALGVRSIVWCTGYKPDFSWIEPAVTDHYGWLATERGVSHMAPGMYCVGMPFQFGLTSALIGGVGRDAAHVVKRIALARSLAA